MKHVIDLREGLRDVLYPASIGFVRGLGRDEVSSPARLDLIERALARTRTLAAETARLESELAGAAEDVADVRAQLAELTGRRSYRLLDRAAQVAKGRGRRPTAQVPVPAEGPQPVAAADPGPGTNDVQAPLAELRQRALRALMEALDTVVEIEAAEAAAGIVRPVVARTRTLVETDCRVLRDTASGWRRLLWLESTLDSLASEHAAVRAEIESVRSRLATRLIPAIRPRSARRELAGDAVIPIAPAPEGAPAVPWMWYQTNGAEVIGFVDLPPREAVVLSSEPLLVAGWGLSAAAPLARVEVAVDGVSVGFARLGQFRRDLTENYAVPHALLAGFEFLCPPEALQDKDTVTLEVVAESMTGERTSLCRRTIWVAGGAGPGPVEAIGMSAHGTSAEPLNLLVITHDLGYGGGQLWLSELLDVAGAGRDFPCTVVAPRTGPLADQLQAWGIRVHLDGKPPITDPSGYDGRLTEMAAWAKRQRFTAILGNTFAVFAGADLAARLELPVVWAIHESWPPSVFWAAAYGPGGIHRALRRRAQRLLAGADKVVFEAEATRRLYAPGMRADAGLVVPYGINTAEIASYCVSTGRAEARAMLGLPAHQFLLLVMGTIEPRKAQTMLTLAFGRIADEFPDASLVLVGGTAGPFTEGLEGFITETGLGEQVRVVPVVPDTYPWYRAADALVCASDVESLPRSVLEAMAFGLPVVATDVFGLPELLTDGETGLLFRSADLNATVAALRRLLTMNPLQRKGIGAAGQRLVLDSYDSAGYAAKFRELLERTGGTAGVEAHEQ